MTCSRCPSPARRAAALPIAGSVALLLASLSAAAQVLPGQIIVDPEHPQWLMRAGGEHVFVCGPGDPEDFLYRGVRLPDGTRDGDQDALIDAVVEHGGNCLYLEVVRSHGGDGPADHNPFIDSGETAGLDQDILDQWEGWFDRMEQHDLLIYLFLYDDSTRVWSTGNAVGPEEEAFVRAIVDRFEHHPNLIWLVSEESEEAMSHSRTRNIAAVIADADEHDHIIGNHHHSGTVFAAWEEGCALDHFAMHYNGGAAAVHPGALEARGFGEAAAPGDAYFVMYTEALHLQGAPVDVVRDFLWDSAMAGVMPMVYKLDIAQHTAALAACRVVQQFFEATDFYTMANRDDLARGGTTWLLADPPRGYIAYAAADAGDLGVAALPAGHYDLTWVDGVSGATVFEPGVAVDEGGARFARPAGIGDRCAVWLSRQWLDLGGAAAGSAGVPSLLMEGPLTPGSLLSLHVEGAPAHAPALLFVAFSSAPAPFLGGTLHAFPFDALVWLATDGAGALSGTVVFGGAPPGTELLFQVGLVDPSVPLHGASLTNGVLGVVP